MRTRPVVDQALLDAAQRACDNVNIHILCNVFNDIKNKWMAFDLADGNSDGKLYDSASEAMRYQKNERYRLYVCFRGLGPAGARPQDLAKLIMFWREAYDAGGQFVDPDQRYSRTPVLTNQRNDYYSGLLYAKSMEQLKAFVKRDHK